MLNYCNACTTLVTYNMDSVIILGQQRPTSIVKMNLPVRWHLHSNTYEFPSLTRNDQAFDATITDIHKETKVIALCSQDRENDHHASNYLCINKNSKCKSLCHARDNPFTLNHNHERLKNKYRPQTCVVIGSEAITLHKETSHCQTGVNATSPSLVRKYMHLGPKSASGNHICKGHGKQLYNIEDGDLVYKEWRAKHMARAKSSYPR